MATPAPYISASSACCPRCDGTAVRPGLVTGFGNYWRCASCGHSWLVPRVIAASSPAAITSREDSQPQDGAFTASPWARTQP